MGVARAQILLAFPFLVFMTSCSRERETIMQETVDLLALYDTGFRRAETTTLAVQGDERSLAFREGWSGPLYHAQKELVAAIVKEAELTFVVVNVEQKWLEFDLSLAGPLSAPQTQQVAAFIGQRLLATWDLGPEADLPVKLELPAALLVRGENRLRFTFAEFMSNPDFSTGVVSNTSYPGIAAYFSNVRLVASSDRDSPGAAAPAFRYLPAEGVLQQTGPSFVEHAFRLVPGAALDIGGDLQGDEGAVVVEFRCESRPTWRKLGTVRGVFERHFTLDVSAAEICQVRLTAERGSCTWRAIRLSGLAGQPTYEYVDRPKPGFRHLVVIVLDALRSDMLARGGDRQNLTPNLNRLAEQALVFDNVTAPSSFTSGSVYAVFCGQNPYSKRLMAEHMPAAVSTPIIREAGFDLAASFATAGYRTVNIFGNFHLKAQYGLSVSFAEEHFIWPDVQEGDRSPRTSWMDQTPVLAAVESMATSAEPSVLYLHYLPPHLPYNPPERFRGFLTGDAASRVAKFPSRLGWLYSFGAADASDPEVQEVFNQYKENVRYADALAGEVLEALAKKGVLQTTLVVVTSDHGEGFLEHGKFKHSSTVFDEMIRVPLMFAHPSLAPGTVSDHVGLIDLAPTLVELFDLPCTGHEFEGRSLWPLMAREAGPWEDRWYFSVAADAGTHFGYRREGLKYILSQARDHLYDLRADPGERHSIHDGAPLLTAWLRQRGQIAIGKANPQEVDTRGVDGDVNVDGLRNLKDLGYIE